jgi:hypothetical protein
VEREREKEEVKEEEKEEKEGLDGEVRDTQTWMEDEIGAKGRMGEE